MRGLTISILMCSVFAMGCPEDVDEANNGSANNGLSNNGTSNNGVSNNGMSNNGLSNNGQTTATNNATTTATTNNSTGATIPSVSVNCAEAELTECFSNLDCQTAQICTNVSDNETQIACCVTGTRGVKVLGDDCTGDDDTTCDSGICIGSTASENLYCSAPCGMDSECPGFMRCVPALGVCAEGARQD